MAFASDLVAPQAVSHIVAGLVVAISHGFYEVHTDDGAVTCTLRGRLRKELVRGESKNGRRGVVTVKLLNRDPVAVGDHVEILPTGPGEGVIERILPRDRDLTRAGPETGKLQTLVAGLDQIIPVFAVRDPEPHLGMLDRFLVLAEAARISSAICFNKVDLGVEPEIAERIDVYHKIGYTIVLTSGSTGEGVKELRELLAGKTSALTGPSGVGKSSLLNLVEPEIGQRVNSISDATGKGRHTTVGTRLFPLSGPRGGYLADTAGLRSLATTTVPDDLLASCYPEFRPLIDQCEMYDCSHLHEPGCAVRSAVAAGAVDALRYRSYQKMRGDVDRLD